MITNNLKETIQLQRKMLRKKLRDPLQQLATKCVNKMHEPEVLEDIIGDICPDLSFCKHMFVLNADGVQITNNITRSGLDRFHLGRDRSNRPYMQEIINRSIDMDFSLSEAYFTG